MNTKTYTPVSLKKRFAAGIYDSCVLIPLLFAASAIAVAVNHGHAISAENLPFQLYLLVLLMVFYCWFWKMRGQTLGMMAWRLKVTDEFGAPLTWTQSCIRFVCATATIGLMGLGWWWALFDSEHQTLYDRLSKTTLSPVD